jgi:pyruvate dehydrogenase complex dehydrogenase (E1) component
MNATDLARVRIQLQRRRREILEASRRAVTAIDQLRRAERDPETAEASQSEQLQYDLSQLGEVEQRVLWLATSMVHAANARRANTSGVKVGGHQASSASMVTLEAEDGM